MLSYQCGNFCNKSSSMHKYLICINKCNIRSGITLHRDGTRHIYHKDTVKGCKVSHEGNLDNIIEMVD